MTNLESTGSDIKAVVELLPIQIAEEAAAILGAQQERLARDLPESSPVCEQLGQAAARLAEAGSLLAGADSCIKGYFENIGLGTGCIATVYNIPEAEARPVRPAARGGIELPATDGLPEDIAQAMHAVYGLFCLPYEANRDELYSYVSTAHKHAKAINACMSREDTVDWMLDALNTIGTKKIFEQTDEFGDVCSYRELLYDSDVDDCIGRLEVMAQNADMQRTRENNAVRNQHGFKPALLVAHRRLSKQICIQIGLIRTRPYLSV